MYNSQETISRIKKMATEKGIQMSELQAMCGISENAVTQTEKSQEGMKAKKLYDIAELLECSVDYLLGRTTNPTAIYPISYPINNTPLDNDINELIELIQSLPLVERSKTIVYVNNLKNKVKNKSKSEIVTENEQSLRNIINSADESLLSIETVIKNLEEEQASRDKEQALHEEEDRKFIERQIASFDKERKGDT